MNYRFGFSDKERKEARERRLSDISTDVWNKNKTTNATAPNAYDAKIFQEGANWYNTGMLLDDAPENLRSNSNFKRGYERAARLAMIEEMMNNDSKNNPSTRK